MTVLAMAWMARAILAGQLAVMARDQGLDCGAGEGLSGWWSAVDGSLLAVQVVPLPGFPTTTR